jgi:diguanylate cyclase (GGDEF)-like protein
MHLASNASSSRRPGPLPLAVLALVTAASSALALLVFGSESLATGGLLLVCGAVMGKALARRRWDRALRDFLAQQGGLGLIEGHSGRTRWPDALRPLAARLHQLWSQQQALFSAQAEQLEALRRLAHNDAMTGLPNRRHFMATLDALLAGDGSAVGAGLILVRVKNLQGMNERIGHVATDHVLQALSQALRLYPDRIERCGVGRLNGSDFALLLPVGGLALETAQSLVQALRVPLTRIDAQASVAAGAVELRAPTRSAQALGLVDQALASAEVDGAFSVASVASDAAEVAGPGQGTWQLRITRALAQGRAELAAFEVQGADGQLLHLDCPLRVQLQPGGPMEPAARWLALATRSQLCGAADEWALALALEAIERDGQARCINFAGQSICSAEFVASASRRMEAVPQAASKLWIDIPEALAADRPLLVRELTHRWHQLGVQVYLEHAGEALTRMNQLGELGLDGVRIASRYIDGVADDDAKDSRRYLQGLVRLVQSVGLRVAAEGVRRHEDLELLWALGFDAATGPALVALPEEALAC